VHGANRLASNSLLEGLVFGARAGKCAAEYIGTKENFINTETDQQQVEETGTLDTEKIRSTLRQVMWNKVGIIRCEKSASAARAWLERKAFIYKASLSSRRDYELRNMMTVASLITDSALLRRGSVGAHFRSDIKERGENGENHSACEKGKDPYWV
jgi:L-aspartate oxidase